MRRLFLLLTVLLAACNSGLPTAPESLTLGYDGRGRLNLPLAGNVVWTLEPSGLQVFPARGIGPAAIELLANGKNLPDQARITYELPWGGDLSGSLHVTWPLVHVTGQVVEATAVSAAIPAAELAAVEEQPEDEGSTGGRVIVRYKSAALAPQGAAAAGSPELRLLETGDRKAC